MRETACNTAGDNQCRPYMASVFSNLTRKRTGPADTLMRRMRPVCAPSRCSRRVGCMPGNGDTNLTISPTDKHSMSVSPLPYLTVITRCTDDCIVCVGHARARPRTGAPEQAHVVDVHRSQRNSDQCGNK